MSTTLAADRDGDCWETLSIEDKPDYRALILIGIAHYFRSHQKVLSYFEGTANGDLTDNLFVISTFPLTHVSITTVFKTYLNPTDTLTTIYLSYIFSLPSNSSYLTETIYKTSWRNERDQRRRLLPESMTQQLLLPLRRRQRQQQVVQQSPRLSQQQQ